MKRKLIDPKTVTTVISNCPLCGVQPKMYKEAYTDYKSQYFVICPKCHRIAFSAISLNTAITYWNQLQERDFL